MKIIISFIYLSLTLLFIYIEKIKSHNAYPPCSMEIEIDRERLYCSGVARITQELDRNYYVHVQTFYSRFCIVKGQNKMEYFLVSWRKYRLSHFNVTDYQVIDCLNERMLNGTLHLKEVCYELNKRIVFPKKKWELVCWNNDHTENFGQITSNQTICYNNKKTQCLIEHSTTEWKEFYLKFRYEECSRLGLRRRNSLKCMVKLNYTREAEVDTFMIPEIDDEIPWGCKILCKSGSIPSITGEQYRIPRNVSNPNQCLFALCHSRSIYSFEFDEHESLKCYGIVIESNMVHKCNWTFINNETQSNLLETKRGSKFCSEKFFQIEACSPKQNITYPSPDNDWTFYTKEGIPICNTLSSYYGPEFENHGCAGDFTETRKSNEVIVTIEETKNEALSGILYCSGEEYNVISGGNYSFPVQSTNTATICSKVIFTQHVVQEKLLPSSPGNETNLKCFSIPLSNKIFYCTLNCGYEETLILLSVSILNTKCIQTNASCQFQECSTLSENYYIYEDDQSNEIEDVVIANSLNELVLSEVNCGTSTTTTTTTTESPTRKKTKNKVGNRSRNYARKVLANKVLYYTEHVLTSIVELLEDVVIFTGSSTHDNRYIYGASENSFSNIYRHQELRSVTDECVTLPDNYGVRCEEFTNGERIPLINVYEETRFCRNKNEITDINQVMCRISYPTSNDTIISYDEYLMNLFNPTSSEID